MNGPNDTETNNSNGESDENGASGKVLQFKRPATAVQPTLRRRAATPAAPQFAPKAKQKSLKGDLMKSRIAKGLQLGLLAFGLLLALKNCGKF